MRKTGFSLLSLVVGVCLLPSAALAQDAAPPAPAPAPDAPGVAPATPATQPGAGPQQAPPPAAAPAPADTAMPAPPSEAVAAPTPTYPTTTISGGIEGTYHRVFAAPHDPNALVPTRAYDSSNGFLLNQASLALKHQLNENVYGVIRFDGGANSGVNNFGASRLFDVREAYGVAQGYGLTFTAGKFATYEGIEVIDGFANPTITRGFLYFLAEPVTHVGAKLHYTTGPVDVGVGVVNGWDTNNGIFATGDNNSQKTVIWRAAVTPVPTFFAAFSGTYGVEKAGDHDPRLSLDLTGAATVGENLVINFQGNYGSEKNTGYIDGGETATWAGFGIQPMFKLAAFQLGARFEYFVDKQLSRSGLGGAINPKDETTGVPANDKTKVNLATFSLAPGYMIAGALLMRGEFRVDHASEESLWAGKKTQTSMALSAAYVF